MDSGLGVSQFTKYCNCEHELQDYMVSVSLVLIRAAVAPSIIKSSVTVIFKSSN